MESEGVRRPKLGAGTCVEEALSSKQWPLSLGPGWRRGRGQKQFLVTHSLSWWLDVACERNWSPVRFVA